MVVVQTGCTGDDDADVDPTTTPAPPVTTTVPTTAAIETVDALDLADALAARDPVVAGAMIERTVPGSAANAYLAHQAAARSLLPPTAPIAARATAVAGSAELCETDGACVPIDELVLDPASGRLASFSVGGRPIDGRVVGAGTEATADGASVTALSSAVGIDGTLTVVVESRNTGSSTIEWFGFAAGYTSGSGAAVDAAGAWGPATVDPDSIEVMLLAFPDADLPGRITMTGLRDDDVDITVVVDVPSPT